MEEETAAGSIAYCTSFIEHSREKEEENANEKKKKRRQSHERVKVVERNVGVAELYSYIAGQDGTTYTAACRKRRERHAHRGE